MALQSLVLPIVSIFRSMGLNSARQALTAITKDFAGFSKQVGMAAGSFAAFSALTTARQFTVDAIDATQKFERNVLALKQVFEGAAPSLMAFTKEVENYGLSQAQASQASVFLGSVLKQYGFSTQEANASTQKLVVLAQDLATTFGYDVQEALLAITALFRGEYDPIEKFGVAMKQNEINAVRAARGLGDLTGAAEMQADAQIRLELLFERASDSMGAFERATDTLYGSQQRLNAELQNLMIAAGAPLQKPLAEINNLFADLLDQAGPQLVEIFDAMGGVIETVGPTLEKLGAAILNVLGFLEQLIGLIDLVLKPVLFGLNTALNMVNPALEFLASIADGVTAVFRNLGLQVGRLAENLKKLPIIGEIIEGFEWFVNNGNGIGAAFDFLTGEIEKQNLAIDAANGDFIEYESGARAAAAAARKAGIAARELNKELAKQEQRLKNAANASLEYLDYLESIGASVGRSDFYVPDKGDATDYIGDFFGSIRDAVAKEQARLKLDAMGASEGLIEAILGAQGWETVYKKIVRDGISGLEKLQSQFDKTAAGIDEITRSLEEAEKAQEAFRKEMLKSYEEKLDNLQEELKKQKDNLVQAQRAMEDFKRWTLDNMTDLQVLPDIEEQLGKFESAIVNTITSMQSQLQSTVRSGLITDADFNKLAAWVATESAALQEIARRRDALAERYALSESLIKEYQTALTASLRLTSLFNSLKNKTEQQTVTEVSKGVYKLKGSLREFNVEVTRSYQQTIENVQDKTAGLLTGFRNMAQRSRDFAENLRKLRDMGLDPMLFNQLVEAGVEASGETAQALVDGGQDSISEINNIFSEINALGAELGLDVGQTMYDAGQDMTFGLLNGIKSEQQQLYDQAKEMATKFSETFKQNLSVAVEVPVKTLEKTIETIEEDIAQVEEAIETIKEVNVDALLKTQGLILGGLKALSGQLSSTVRAGVIEKVAALGGLYKDIFAGNVTDISGISAGMSSADFRAAALATGGANVTQYYDITVAGGNRLQQQQTVEELRKFISQNGSLSSWIKV